ncbi:ArsR/SmtB family transcription factor [Nocardioides halotolerans]|uniref:ArsR/SmtB family transcription factor n=1 Tax=Nocardioides halotolerans TaxID=433660 RepID=UPI0003F6A03E|nr:helix-turn-helix domain-containing protein [Nocardioides halotolerans]
MEQLPAISPMGTLREVLEALSDPVRLEMVRRLAAEGAPVACADLYDSVSKSTASHHFKVLREAGVTERLTVGGQTHQRLRLADLEEAFPGVVTSIVASSDASGAAAPATR